VFISLQTFDVTGTVCGFTLQELVLAGSCWLTALRLPVTNNRRLCEMLHVVPAFFSFVYHSKVETLWQAFLNFFSRVPFDVACS